ncbi:hypothetical protein EJB05_46464, partial [Eragrostis curvula]
MDRILLTSLVGAAPGNVFGPGMCAGAMEVFARDARGSNKAGGAGGTGPAGGVRPAAAKDGQEQGVADATARLGSASDGRFSFFEFVAPH